MSAAPIDLNAGAGWRAHLELEFEARGERTVLASRKHTGPLVVQRAFHPEGPICHVYIVHPPGGVVGGDELQLTASVCPGSHALITTPAATKFYRAAAGRMATVTQTVQVREAILEWLPQESIFFNAAQVDLTTRICLDGTSRFIGWELACYGRPASHEMFVSGATRQRFEVWRDGRPVLLDRLQVSGGDAMMTAPWGLANHSVIGTLLASPAVKGDLDAVRAQSGNLSCTLVDGLLVCRALAGDALEAKRHMFDAWQALRPRVIGREALAPRIWAT